MGDSKQVGPLVGILASVNHRHCSQKLIISNIAIVEIGEKIFGVMAKLFEVSIH